MNYYQTQVQWIRIHKIKEKLFPHRAASPMDDLNRWEEVIENIFIILTNKGLLKNIVDLEDEC